ncbi:MAG: hypothetical protein SNH35_00495 [Rikenellaceae bacterium]
MSIRITSNGHNFSNIDTISPVEGEMVTIVVESIKAMLIPTPLFDEVTPKEHLLSGGISFEADKEDVVVVKHDKLTTALIVVPISLLSEIEKLYGSNVRFSTPLLNSAFGRGHEVCLHLSPDNTLLCINLYNGGDRVFSELFEVKTSADVLYWLSRIGEGYDLDDYTLYIEGGGKELLKLLNRYYKNVIPCE